jgi:hypothetical protein
MPKSDSPKKQPKDEIPSPIIVDSPVYRLLKSVAEATVTSDEASAAQRVTQPDNPGHKGAPE